MIRGYLQLEVVGNVLCVAHLLMKHIVDTLAYLTMPRFSLLRLGQPGLPQLVTYWFVFSLFSGVLVDIGLDVLRYLGQPHQLLPDLGIVLVHLAKLDGDLVHDHLVAKSVGRVSGAIECVPEVASVAIPGVDGRPYAPID